MLSSNLNFLRICMCLKTSVHYMRVNNRFQTIHYNFDTVHIVSRLRVVPCQKETKYPFIKFFWLYNCIENVIKVLHDMLPCHMCLANHMFHSWNLWEPNYFNDYLAVPCTDHIWITCPNTNVHIDITVHKLCPTACLLATLSFPYTQTLWLTTWPQTSVGTFFYTSQVTV